ncbi:CLUMA_CG019883, isoform A [Clunio marinus]|uniref:CLUMA_CG019883, isoform A n=1 Tax=Clunio marinus TaxID=568069 RepID=A0A1J1J3G7_9DIPT|nr:CLUMA_CG019883, isoform A [Clunio marinus]
MNTISTLTMSVLIGECLSCLSQSRNLEFRVVDKIINTQLVIASLVKVFAIHQPTKPFIHPSIHPSIRSALLDQ